MRNSNSTVNMGWTTVRSPKRKAEACSTNTTRRRAKPSNQIPRLSALVSNRRRMASPAGADSTPIRCITPATALHSAAQAAKR